MQELQLQQQMDITGGSPLYWLVYVAIGGAIYKILTSKKGRISLPKVFSIEWQD